MHCAGCEAVISTAVKELPGIGAVNADHIKKTVHICFDDAIISPSTILACIESKGYCYGINAEEISWHNRLKQIAVFLMLLALVGGISFYGKTR